MILILSSKIEYSTAAVIFWLNHMKAKWCRINHFLNEDVDEKMDFDINLKNTFSLAKILKNEKLIDLHDINVVWFRRFQTSNIISQSSEALLSNEVISNLTNIKFTEKRALFSGICHFLEDKIWLSKPKTIDINKLFQLKMAQYFKIDIPLTIVTTTKKDVENFINSHPSSKFITKALQNIQPIQYEQYKTYFSIYTNLIDNNSLEIMPDNFFPSLFQQYIEKELEIRCFYLDGQFFSCAMFTQENQQTAIDFRRYDYNNPTRRVPYLLPARIEKKLHKLMLKLGLNTGSIDLILSNNKYYFLEVNPVGQFGFVSHPCNYYIEKKIANFLKLQDDGVQKKRNK